MLYVSNGLLTNLEQSTHFIFISIPNKSGLLSSMIKSSDIWGNMTCQERTIKICHDSSNYILNKTTVKTEALNEFRMSNLICKVRQFGSTMKSAHRSGFNSHTSIHLVHSVKLTIQNTHSMRFLSNSLAQVFDIKEFPIRIPG